MSESWSGVKSTRHAKYMCNYHFVGIPKYRRDVLDEVIEYTKYTKEVLEKIARELGCEIIACGIRTHPPVRIMPTSLCSIVFATSRKKARNFADGAKSWGKQRQIVDEKLLRRHCCIGSEMIKRYIEEAKSYAD